jgi:hypothetical protein
MTTTEITEYWWLLPLLLIFFVASGKAVVAAVLADIIEMLTNETISYGKR